MREHLTDREFRQEYEQLAQERDALAAQLFEQQQDQQRIESASQRHEELRDRARAGAREQGLPDPSALPISVLAGEDRTRLAQAVSDWVQQNPLENFAEAGSREAAIEVQQNRLVSFVNQQGVNASIEDIEALFQELEEERNAEEEQRKAEEEEQGKNDLIERNRRQSKFAL